MENKAINSGVAIYNYMNTIFCCEVSRDKFCVEMVTEHMLCHLCSGGMELISPTRRYKLKKGDAFFVRRNHLKRKIKKPSIPANALAVGNPARVIKYIDNSEK